MTAFADKLRDLANRADTLEAADLAGELERLRFVVWQTAAAPAPIAADPSSDALNVDQVAGRLGVSRQWVYRASRPGGSLHACARRVGRRVTYDPVAVTRWLARRPR